MGGGLFGSVVCGGGAGASSFLGDDDPFVAGVGVWAGVGSGAGGDCFRWVGEDGAELVAGGSTSILSGDSRALMAESAESRLISSGGRLRGWVLASTLFRRKEEDLPRSEDALAKCREERLGSAPAEEGVAGEAGLADFFVGEAEADFDFDRDFAGDFAGDDDSGYERDR